MLEIIYPTSDMLGNGDYPKSVIGDGSQTSPALALFSENSTGLYLENPGTSSSFTVVKRGNKRIRVEDDSTEIVGPLIAEDLGATSFSAEDGSESAPSYSFLNEPGTGMYQVNAGLGPRIKFSTGGTERLSISDTQIYTNTDMGVLGDITGYQRVYGDFQASNNRYGFVNNPSQTFISNYDFGPDEYVSVDVGAHTIASFVDGATPRLDVGVNQLRCGQVSCSAMTTGSINCQSISAGANTVSCGSITCGAITASGTLSSGAITSSGAINNGSNTISCGSLQASNTSALRITNNSQIEGITTGAATEIAIVPRDNTNSLKLRMGTGGMLVNNNSNTNVWTFGTGGDIKSALSTGGLTMKSTAVSAGSGNGSFNSSVVLVGGTATVTNTYVTTACVGIPTVVTAGGTPGAHYVTCGSGTYTVTSTSPTDTSTLNIFFVKSF